MNEEKTPMNSPDNHPGGNRVQALETRKKELLQRKDQVKDSFVSRHIDCLLLEVEDLLTEYNRSGPLHRE
jgi:hypothetical protein